MSYGPPEYNAWWNACARCHDPRNKWYAAYGGRGIWVVTAWRESYPTFLRDMGPRPGPGYSLDRIDNDGPYSPINCRWATARQQQGNTRRCHRLRIAGEVLSLSEAARRFGVPRTTLAWRLANGWVPAMALGIAGRA